VPQFVTCGLSCGEGSFVKVLDCTVKYFTVLHCTVLYCTVLYHTREGRGSSCDWYCARNKSSRGFLHSHE